MTCDSRPFFFWLKAHGLEFSCDDDDLERLFHAGCRPLPFAPALLPTDINLAGPLLDRVTTRSPAISGIKSLPYPDIFIL